MSYQDETDWAQETRTGASALMIGMFACGASGFIIGILFMGAIWWAVS